MVTDYFISPTDFSGTPSSELPLPESTPLVDVPDATPLNVEGFDFDSIELPEVEAIDYESLMSDLSGTTGSVTDDALSQAFGAASGVVDSNTAALGEAFNTAIGQTATGYQDLSESLLATNMGVLDAINPEWRNLLDTATEAAGTTASQLTVFLAANLPSMLEQGADIATQQGRLVQTLLSGEIPDDVAAQVSRRSAETAQAFGLFGGAAGGAGRAMEARDLGLTSMQMQTLGNAMAGDTAALWSNTTTAAAGMAASAMAPIDSLIAMQNSLGLQPDVDANKMFSDTFADNAEATTIDPTQVFSSALSEYNTVMGWGLDIARTNQMVQAQYDSMVLQYETDRMGATAAMRNAQLAADAQLQASAIEAASTQNAAAIAANATTTAAWYNAEASLGEAQMRADSLVTVAGIENGKFVREQVGSEYDPGYNSPGGYYDRAPRRIPIYGDVFKPAF